MKKILIAYDGTAGAEAALQDLKQAGMPDAAEARILTIADVWLPPDAELNEPQFPTGTPPAQIAARHHALQALAEARKVAANGAAELRAIFPGWNVEQTARADSPAWAILGEARRWPADLVVVGSHGRSPLERFFLGSVSSKVVAEACCSVRIFRPQRRGDDSSLRVLVAIDGSGDSMAAVDEALGRAWPLQTEFDLLTIVDPKLQSRPGQAEGAARAEDWIRPMLEEQAGRFKARGHSAVIHILEGEFKTLVLKHAEMWKTDCIFLGARGLDHRSRLYLGTSASAIATRAHCTVEIVRSKLPQPGAAEANREDVALLQPV